MSEPFEFCFPPEPEHLRAMRRLVRQRLGKDGVGDHAIEMLLLVLDEIVSNAIEHGLTYRKLHDPLLVRVHRNGDAVELEFEDPETPVELVQKLKAVLGTSGIDLPPIANERGRGLFLVAALLQDIRITIRTHGGLRLTGRLPGVSA